MLFLSSAQIRPNHAGNTCAHEKGGGGGELQDLKSYDLTKFDFLIDSKSYILLSRIIFEYMCSPTLTVRLARGKYVRMWLGYRITVHF